MKPFQLKCGGCEKLVESVSWKGLWSALRRHAVHHKKSDFPLKYKVLRSNGHLIRSAFE